MKIGVASGEVDRFLVGDPSSGLFGLAADTPLDRMAATEHLAAKGEIIGAPEVVSATPAEPWQHRQDGYACLRGLAKPFDYPQEPEEGVAEHRRSLTGSGLETLPNNCGDPSTIPSTALRVSPQGHGISWRLNIVEA